MRFPGAGRPDEMHDFAAVDEFQLGEGQDPASVERRLEREFKARQRLDGRQPGHGEGRLDAAALAQRQLLGEHGVDRLERADLTALELTQDGVENLDAPVACAVRQRVFDVVDEGGGEFAARAHHALPFTASTRPSAS